MPWPKGKPRSAADKEKIAAGQVGRKHSEETKKKIGQSKIGKPRSEETRQKISEGRKAMLASLPEEERRALSASNGMKGKRHSEKTKEKIGASRQGVVYSEEARAKISKKAQLRWDSIPAEQRKGIFKGRPARPQTTEEREKRSRTLQKHWRSLSDAERDRRTSMCTERLRSGLPILLAKRHDTRIERLVKGQLDRDGVEYIAQHPIGYYVVDLFIPIQNKIIEVNGCYWHGCSQCGHEHRNKSNQARDKRKIKWLEQQGYTVEVIWEHNLQPRYPKIKTGDPIA